MPSPEPGTHAARPLRSPSDFPDHLAWRLAATDNPGFAPDAALGQKDGLSVVLLLVGDERLSRAHDAVPCLILNKRSQKVRQPGDICCPGGGVEPVLDRVLARLLRLPGSPLRRWRCYPHWRRAHPRDLRRLELLLATALREGLEEMRLNPMAVRFLGSLPPEPLVMFRRVIQPLVVWVHGQRRFYPNWEVERVVRIPLNALMDPTRYICYRLTLPGSSAGRVDGGRIDFPAFRFATPHGNEILWGATYRIAMAFLKRVMGFTAPALDALEVIEHALPPQYMTGDG